MTGPRDVIRTVRDHRRAVVIMLQGTSSDVGKSLLATALCRIFRQDGLRPAPFKAQNMSLNSYVTPDGKEIGRAQGMQADACGIPATTDMNPILLKPKQDMASQVVVHGRPYMDMEARAYRERYLPLAEGIVKEALERLRAVYDVVVIEGAGSPAEVNLKDRDIVNMRLAEWADAPVLLVADIDRGGMFASIVGTMEILQPEERDRVRGVIVNKFRGDVSFLKPGLDWLEARIGKPVLGVVPYLPDLALEDEDSASLEAKAASAALRQSGRNAAAAGESGAAIASAGSESRAGRENGSGNETAQRENGAGNAAIPTGNESGTGTGSNGFAEGGTLDIAVLRLPRMANFTDVDPLLTEPDVRLRFVSSVSQWGEPDIVILPGSKNTVADLRFLYDSGLAFKLLAHVEGGGRLLAICGGYQMLGRRLLDPELVESDLPEIEGLGLIPAETVFVREKRTERVAGVAELPFAPAGEPVEGYEIHRGRTSFLEAVKHPFRIGAGDGSRADGYVSDDGKVWGTCLHGILHHDGLRRAWLNEARRAKGWPEVGAAEAFRERRERSFDRLARHVREHLDMERIYRILLKKEADPREQT